MIRLFILIRRDPRETHQEFMHWWSNRHAKLAAQMPGLRRYVLHEVTSGFEKDLEWDGLAELHFDSVEASRAAFKSEEGRRTLEDAKGRGGARLMLLTRHLDVLIAGNQQ